MYARSSMVHPRALAPRRRTRSFARALAAGLAGAAFFAGSAEAQEPSEEPPVIAPPPEPAPIAPSRDQLVGDAQAAADRGDHRGALTLAEQAAALEETPSLRLFIAQQQGLTGRTGEAIQSARQCAASAHTAIRNRQAILSTCQRLERELMRRVALVTVRVPEGQSGLAVRVNGQALPPDQWGEPLPVPPGEVRIEATLGASSMRQILRIDAGDESTIELSLDGGELRSVEQREERGAAPSRPSAIDPLWMAVPLGGAGAFGLVAIVTGAVTLERGGAYDVLVDRCVSGDGAGCAEAPGVRSEGEALRDATNASWAIAGAFAVAAGVLALFVDWGEGEALIAWQRGERWAALRF
jgi:hypothetical protein